MIINSHHVEFGYELLSVIPYAYYHYTMGSLSKTISGKDTKDWYYFSSNHEEIDLNRGWGNMDKLSIPNKNVHSKFNFSQWRFPDYKNQYQNEGNNIFNFKNLIIISNKYNLEWGRNPINYIHPQTLNLIFEYLTNKGYTIVYNRLTPFMKYDDGVECLDLTDFDLINTIYPNVITIQSLIQNTKLKFNEIQLRLYSTCNKFISVQGGTSIISSMFGGENVVLNNMGWENTSGIYKKVFSKLSNVKLNIVGSQISPSNININYEQTQIDLLNKIIEVY